MPFIFLGYSAFFFALFLFLGFGLTVLLTPDKIEKHALFLSPVIGYAYCTLAGWYFYSLSSRPADLYAPLILIPPALLLPFALLRLKKRRAFPTVFSRDLLPPLLIALAVYLLVTLPMLRYPGFTCLTLGNNDIAFNSLVARVIKEFPKSEYHRIDFFWPPSLVKDHIAFAPFGTYFISAFMSSVSGLEVYQVQMFLLYVFMAVTVLLTFPVARETFGYQPLGAGFVTLLFGLNTINHYVVYQGFQHQTISISLMLTLFLIGILAGRENQSRGVLAWLPFSCLLFWAMIVTYLHMLLLTLGLVCLWLVAEKTRLKSSAKNVMNLFLLTAASLGVAFIASPARLLGSYQFLHWVIKANAADAGWFVKIIPPPKIFGLISFITRFRPFDSLPLPTILLLYVYILMLFLFLSIFAGFYQLRKKKSPFFFPSLAIFIALTTGFLIFSFLGRTDQGWGGYKSFKFIAYFLPLYLMSALVIFHDLNLKNQTKNILVMSAALIFLFLNLNASFQSKTLVPINSDTVELKILQNISQNTSINIPKEEVPKVGGVWWNTLWETYFLTPRKLYFEEATYFMPSKSMDGEWWLVRKIHGKMTPDLTRGDWGPVIYINPTYSLAKIHERRYSSVKK